MIPNEPLMVLESPTRIRFENCEGKRPQLQSLLTYQDKRVDYEIRTLKKATWFRSKDPEAWAEKLEALKAERTRCLLFEDDKGLWTYSGLGTLIAKTLNILTRGEVRYPD